MENRIISSQKSGQSTDLFHWAMMARDFNIRSITNLYYYQEANMPLIAIPADEGRTFFGADDGEISPCNVYWDTATPTNLAGTVITATSSTTITGAGTAFLTDFRIGDWIYINNPTPILRQITNITSNTAMTVSQAVYTGSEVVVGEGTIARMSAILNGFYAERQSTSPGTYQGYAQRFALGQLDSAIVKQMKLIKIVGNGESTDPLDTVTFWRAAPASSVEAKYDATTQRSVKSMFTIYLDDTRQIGGQPIFYSSGTVTLDVL
jgi:hypothetical protein